ncbi:MAG TPA: SusC/RagA family TonB-linked outer membrane protein, partial [Bacteroides sp.]|nr:SusC/RagA family TonB-linked outer membrane protein [Bacteroides sp.]
MKKVLFFLVLIAAMILNVNAQDRTLAGTVISSEDGLPLIGATIVLQGTTVGVITDVNGKFQIAYDGSAESLLISYIGYEAMEIPITSSNVYDVSMNPSTIGLDEVVVTALGITREKKTLGYAV